MRKLVPRRRGTQQSFSREGVAQRFNPNLVPRSHSVLHLAVGDLGSRLVHPLALTLLSEKVPVVVNLLFQVIFVFPLFQIHWHTLLFPKTMGK